MVRKKKNISVDLENAGQGHYLEKSYLSYYTAGFNHFKADFYHFHQNNATGAANKSIVSAGLESVGEDHIL